MGGRRSALVVVTIVAATALGWLMGYSASPAVPLFNGSPSQIDIGAVYDLRVGSVVQVHASVRNGDDINGSGFVWNDDGNIVTNAHVVQRAGRDVVSVSVSTMEGNTLPGRIVGIDPYSDIAVIHVPELDLPPIPTTNRSPRVGTPVAAIGSPFGRMGSISAGIVSGPPRRLPSIITTADIPDAIQFDAVINRGNSGGPLLDGYGNLVGVVTQIRTDSGLYEGIAFAIPSLTVERVASQLLKNGRNDHAILGIEPMTISPQFAEREGITRGAIVQKVIEGSPAHAIGLTSSQKYAYDGETKVFLGDVIIEIDGNEITGANSVFRTISSLKPGDEVEVVWLRDGSRMSSMVKLSSRT